jgi:O-antigen ligase
MGMYSPFGDGASTNNWFIGYYTNIAVTLCFCLFIAMMYSYFNKGSYISFNVLVLLTVTIVSTIMVWAATSLVGLFTIVVYIVLERIKVFSKLLNYWTYLVLYVFAFFAIVIYRLQDYISFLIEDILQRSITFTGRTLIWDYYIARIAEKPFMGHGYLREDYYNPHNHTLGLLFYGGAVLLVIFIFLLVIPGKKLMKNKSNQMSGIVSIFFLFNFESMINGMAPITGESFIWALFVFAYHMPTICAQHEAFLSRSEGNDSVGHSKYRLLRYRTVIR